MGRLIKYLAHISIIILCLSHHIAFGQVQSDIQDIMIKTIPKEKVVVHLNDKLLLTGDTFYYKVFCLSEQTNQLSDISKIVYVELIGENSNALFNQKLKLVNGMASGDYFISSDIKTGNYKLIAYTKWMINNPQNSFFVKDIYIINPYIPTSNLLKNTSENDKSVKIQIRKTRSVQSGITKNVGVQLKTDFDIYKPRSRVLLELDNTFGTSMYGNYTVSVKKIDSVEVETANSVELKKAINTTNTFYLPELRGEIVSGYVVSKDHDSVIPNKIVALSIPGKNYVYKNVLTDKFGVFYFNLDERYTNSECVLQILDPDRNDYKIVLDGSQFKYFGTLKFQKIQLSSNIQNWVQNQSIYNQIENAYSASKLDSILPLSFLKPFYEKPSITYVLDDYKRFSTLKETFTEVIEGGFVRRHKGVNKLIVRRNNVSTFNPYDERDPLILLDGVLIQDSEYILNYDASKIEKVSLVKEIYFYGPSIFNGIIDITTKKGDFYLPPKVDGISYLNLDIPKERREYYQPNYDNNGQMLKRIPDYRSQLLWEPNIDLKSKSKSIEFYTSDLEGTFEIQFEGYTLNGAHVNSKSYFKVKN
ncbi:hypothetical protein [Flavivirga algicola]|uniref:TonB-dependent receptor plug domain-containing protein n=1 Tax=Flavivirga algicola TaxID=2729136 RepID=A0ABX1RXZ9_9FLAO|nr:hypothetical protein [Flavivirga algicola]NMH87079.1 hypothetical protein [Flavivirga algicola]